MTTSTASISHLKKIQEYIQDYLERFQYTAENSSKMTHLIWNIEDEIKSVRRLKDQNDSFQNRLSPEIFVHFIVPYLDMKVNDSYRTLALTCKQWRQHLNYIVSRRYRPRYVLGFKLTTSHWIRMKSYEICDNEKIFLLTDKKHIFHVDDYRIALKRLQFDGSTSKNSFFTTLAISTFDEAKYKILRAKCIHDHLYILVRNQSRYELLLYSNNNNNNNIWHPSRRYLLSEKTFGTDSRKTVIHGFIINKDETKLYLYLGDRILVMLQIPTDIKPSNKTSRELIIKKRYQLNDMNNDLYNEIFLDQDVHPNSHTWIFIRTDLFIRVTCLKQKREFSFVFPKCQSTHCEVSHYWVNTHFEWIILIVVEDKTTTHLGHYIGQFLFDKKWKYHLYILNYECQILYQRTFDNFNDRVRFIYQDLTLWLFEDNVYSEYQIKAI